MTIVVLDLAEARALGYIAGPGADLFTLNLNMTENIAPMLSKDITEVIFDEPNRLLWRYTVETNRLDAVLREVLEKIRQTKVNIA